MTRPRTEVDTTRSTASLPGLEIEIVHRRPSENVEQISINLQATPSFETFGRFLDTSSPFALWARAMQTAWLPWALAARMTVLPLALPLALPWAMTAPPPQLRAPDAPPTSPDDHV